MLKFSRYIVEQEAPQSGGALFQGQKAPTEEDLKKALEALKDYPPEQRAALEQQIRQSYEQQKGMAQGFAQAGAAEKALSTLPQEGLLDVAARSLGIQAGPVVPGVDAYKEQADTPEKTERHNKAREYFYGTSIGNVESQKKLRDLLGKERFSTEPVTADDIKKAGLDPDEVWKNIDPGTYYANAPLEQQMQAASAGSREARFALGGPAGAWEAMQVAQEGLPGLAAGIAGVGTALGRAPAPTTTAAGAAAKPAQQPAKPVEPFAPSLGPGVRGPAAGGKPTTTAPGKVTTALANILVAVAATRGPAPTSPTGVPFEPVAAQTAPGTPAPGGARAPVAPATPAVPARPAAPTQAPVEPAVPGGGGVQAGGRAPAPAPVIPPVAPLAPAPAPTPSQAPAAPAPAAPAEAPKEISPVPQKGLQIGNIVPAIGMVQAAKDAVQKSIEDAKKDATGQETPSTTEDKAKAEAEAKAKAEAPAQAPAEAPAQAPAQQPAKVPSPVKQPTPGEAPGGVRPGRVTPPTPRTPTPPLPVPPPFSPAPKKKQPEKEEPSPSGGSGVGQMFISGLATTTKEAEPIIKSFKFRKESISPEILIQRARLSMINEVLFSIIERKEDEEEYLPAEDEDSCGEGPMGGNAGMFVSAQEQPPEPEVPEIKFKKSRA